MNTGSIWKEVGETPLQAIRRFRVRYLIPDNVPISYSGRLDPMAEGKILVLIGDECKKEEEYRSLDKEYIVEVLLGISTDTGDILGMPNLSPSNDPFSVESIRPVLRKQLGVHSWPYPHYSSKAVRGKALHQWAREGKIHEIELPLTTSRIHTIRLNTMVTVSSSELRDTVLKKLSRLTHFNGGKPCDDFRQSAIEKNWRHLLNPSDTRFQILTITSVAGTGTYMRTLAEHIGASLGTKACAISITRTKIGRRRSLLGLHFWWPRW